MKTIFKKKADYINDMFFFHKRSGKPTKPIKITSLIHGIRDAKKRFLYLLLLEEIGSLLRNACPDKTEQLAWRSAWPGNHSCTNESDGNRIS